MKNRIIYILFLGIILRIAYWLYTSPFITAGISIWGIMARDIVEFRCFPIWKYSTQTIGAVFSYILAIFTPILGINELNLLFAELLFAVLFILSVYFVGREIFDKRGGVISAVLVSFAPWVLIKSAIYPTGVYNILLFFGNSLFLLTLMINKGNDRLLLYALFGFIAGVSLWINFFSICFLIPCVAFIIINKKWNSSYVAINRATLSIICFLFGSLPFWWSNFGNRFEMFNNIKLRDLEDILVYHAKDVLFLNLNNLFDVKSIFTISALLSFIYFISFIYLFFKLRDKIFRSKLSLHLFFIILGVILIARIDISPSLELPPSILLYISFPYVVTYLILNILKKSRFYIFGPLIFIIILQLSDCSLNAIGERAGNIVKNDSIKKMMLRLKEANINYLYTIPELVPGINFLSEKEIAVSCDRHDFGLNNSAIEVKDESSALLPLEKCDIFKDNLGYVCNGYKRMLLGQYVLFHSFKKPLGRHKEVSPLKWSAVSNYNSEDAMFAFDRDAGTRWTTNAMQMPDMCFSLDLGEDIIIDKIIIYLSGNVLDRALGIKIETSKDKDNWKELVYLEDNSNILFWSYRHLFWANYADRQEYRFKPVEARYIKLSQIGSKEDFGRYWSIVEIFVYSPIGKERSPYYDIARLNSYLREKGLYNVYTDYWLLENSIGNTGRIIKDGGASGNPVIITDKETDIEDSIKKYNIVYEKSEIDDFCVYLLRLPNSKLMPIDKKSWSGGSNIQPNHIEMAFDNNLMTSWSSQKVQSHGYYFQINLREEKNISGVRLWHEGSQDNWPRGMKIEYLDSNNKWKALNYRKDFYGLLFWTGFNIIVNSLRYNTYVFNPVKTNAIRCTLVDNNPYFYWSIHEADILEEKS